VKLMAGTIGKRQLQVIGIVGVIAISIIFAKLSLEGTTSIPNDKYVFLQVEENISGAPVAIDKPIPYSFDETSGTLLCRSSFEISDNLVTVIGKRTVVKEPGGGAAGGPIPIYTIPSSLETLTLRSEILSVESDGTIHLTCDNTRIELKLGEEFENEYTTEWMGYQVNCIITFKNYGLQDKDKISFES